MKSSNVKKNYLFTVISQLATIAIPLIVNPYISRIFGAEGIGIYSYTSANVTYFVIFGMLGISGHGQREIAIYRENKFESSKIFWELQIFHTVTFIITTTVYIVLIITSKDYAIYYVVQYITILASFLDINWFYQAYEKFKFIAIRNFIIKVFTLILILTFVKEKQDLYIYVLILSLGTLISNLSLWINLKNYIEYVPLKCLNIKRHIRSIFVFFIPTIAASVYSVLDKSVINWVTKDISENGYYEQAYKLLVLANIPVQTLASVSAPRMSNLYSKNDSDFFAKELNTYLRFMLFTSLPIAFGLVAIANRFVPFFFGQGFDKVVYLLYVFAPMVVVVGFSVYLDNMYIVPSGRRAESAKAICIGAASNFVLNFVLVYLFKSIGAAMATLLTECIVMLLMVRISSNIIDWNFLKKFFKKYCFASIIMCVMVLLYTKLIINDFLCLVLQITGGATIYLIVLLVMKDDMIYKYLKKLEKD